MFCAHVAAAWAAELTTTPGAFWINFRVWHTDAWMQSRVGWFLFHLFQNVSLQLFKVMTRDGNLFLFPNNVRAGVLQR